MKFEINTDKETLHQVCIALKEYEYAHSGIGLTSGFVSIIDNLEDVLESVNDLPDSLINKIDAIADEEALDIFNI